MSDISTTGDFYQRLISFPEFADFTDDRHFYAVPEDWTIVVTDVKGSTGAIEEGRYKDVNTIGAATISTVHEKLQREFPFVFGGDGATLLLAPRDLDAALDALCGLRRLAKENFDIELRIGCVGAKEVYERGGNILVGKHELAAGKCIALFRGGGLQLAESLVKEQEERYCLVDRGSPPSELIGLTCRWEPIVNRRGQMLALLVMSRDGGTETYRSVLKEMRNIYRGNLEQANPVHVERMTYATISEVWSRERRQLRAGFSFSLLSHMYKLMVNFIFLRWRVGKRFFDYDHYIRSLKSHADHRKFDDMLRMVIDCSAKEFEQVESLLQRMHDEGRLFYGLHRSANALMTCYVQRAEDGKHIHFIDVDEGGYAVAAKQLKSQIHAAA